VIAGKLAIVPAEPRAVFAVLGRSTWPSDDVTWRSGTVAVSRRLVGVTGTASARRRVGRL